MPAREYYMEEIKSEVFSQNGEEKKMWINGEKVQIKSTGNF